MIERLQTYLAQCDSCQTRSPIYHAPQTGVPALPSGWVRVPGDGVTNYSRAATERILCPACAIKRREGR